MCGLVFSISKKKILKKQILKTIKVMENRGPDYQSFLEDKIKNNNLLFLFSRLSIIDLKKRSNQPYIKKNCILIFNGEIYNFLEIKRYLQSKEVLFETNSDTEVLLEAYIYWGESFVDHLKGMWAFVIYDRDKKEVIISRDKYAEKPLFCYEDKEKIIFASETKYIKTILSKKLTKNISKLRENIQFGYKSMFLNQESFFKNIKIFPSSGFVKLKLNYNPKYKIKKKLFNFSKRANKNNKNIRDILINSLKIRLRSDVPVAFSLSGGVDSNILAGITSKIFQKKVFSYSIIDDDARYNEKKIIDYVVKKNNYDHNYIKISNRDHFNELIKVTKYFDSPVPTINFLVQNYLMQEVHKDKKKVLISGIGADEIFTGYHHHFNFYFNNHNRNFKKNYNHWKKYTLPNIRNKDFKNLVQLKKSKYLHSNNSFFLKNPFKNFPYSVQRLSSDKIKNRLMNELYFETVPVMTHSEDLNSMMYSIENRNPYLDKDLINYVSTINSKHYIQKGFSKYLLRASFQDLGLNKVINNYKKTGFNYSFRTLFPLKDGRILSFIKKKSAIFDFLKKNETINFFRKKVFNDEENKLAFSILTTKVFLDYN